MEDKIQRLVNAANSTNAKAKEIGEMQLRELGLDNNGNPLKSSSTKETKPKAERKKREPKAKGEPKPKYKVGDLLNHTNNGNKYKVMIKSVTGWTGDEHRYEIEFVDDSFRPMYKFATSYDKNLSKMPKSKAEQTPKSKADQPYDCDDLIAKAEQRKAKAKANAIKRANEPKKTQATKNVEAVDRTAERVEKNVEKRVGKGDVSVAEIDKIIAEYETALTKLRALREKATSKMAKGGGVDSEEVEHILMKAQGVKEHHCGCGGNKMATGGGVDNGYEMESFEQFRNKSIYASELWDNLSSTDRAKLLKSENVGMNPIHINKYKDKPYNDLPLLYKNDVKNELLADQMAKGGGVGSDIKYRAEVGGIGENVWSSNSMEYDTEQEAKDWLNNLSSRWFGYDIARVVTTDTPNRQTIDANTQDIYQNFRSSSKYAKGGSLIGKRANLDRNKNGKIDSEDLQMIRENKMAKGGTIKVGDRVKSTTFKGLSGTILSGSKDKDYWFVVLDEKLPNGDIQHDVFRKDEVEKIGKGDSMANGGGVGEKISEAEAKNKLMSLKEKGEIILRTGNHGQIFMSLKGSQLKSYDDYTEAFHNWVVAKNRNSQ